MTRSSTTTKGLKGHTRACRRPASTGSPGATTAPWGVRGSLPELASWAPTHRMRNPFYVWPVTRYRYVRPSRSGADATDILLGTLFCPCIPSSAGTCRALCVALNPFQSYGRRSTAADQYGRSCSANRPVAIQSSRTSRDVICSTNQYMALASSGPMQSIGMGVSPGLGDGMISSCGVGR